MTPVQRIEEYGVNEQCHRQGMYIFFNIIFLLLRESKTEKNQNN